MNAKLWICVIVGVLVAHISVLFIIDHFRESRRPHPVAPEPNFTGSTRTFTNEQGEKVKVMHEFTVDTGFTPPEVLKKLPSPPQQGAAEQAEKAVVPEHAR